MLHQSVRPKSLSKLVGNRSAKIALKALISSGDIPHALLFHGPSGCGKTTLARIVASVVGVDGSDLMEINAANFRGIDDAREIAKGAEFSPLMSTSKVYIIDEAHQLTTAAQNVLLKPVEDHAARTYFFFCTTEPDKLIPTLRNRCTPIPVARCSDTEIKRLVDRICKEQEFEVGEDIREAIVQVSDGCPRTALVKLEAVTLISEFEDALSVVYEGTEHQSEVIDLCRLICNPKKKAPWKKVVEVYRSLEVSDPEKIRRAILGYLRGCMVRRRFNKKTKEEIPLSQLEGEFFCGMIQIFEPSLFYCGEAGLLRMIWDARNV